MLSPTELRTWFVSALRDADFDWLDTSAATGPLIGIIVGPGGVQQPVVVYLRNVTHGGGEARPAAEYRIQVANVPPLSEDPAGHTRLLIGIAEDFNACVGFEAARHIKPGASPSSVQVAQASLEACARMGIVVQSKGLGETACALRPDCLGAYAIDPISAHGDVGSVATLDVAQDRAEALALQAARPRRGAGQGLDQDHARRVAVELHAMRVVQQVLEDEGWTVEDVSHVQSYDLLARRGAEELRAEVKGTVGRGHEVLVTAAEVRHARDLHPHVSLFVLSEIDVQPGPTAIGGILHRVDGWAPTDDDLRATTYRCIVPGR